MRVIYFIPQKNRLSRFIYMRPFYRYGIIIMALCLFFGWRYGLYIWLDAAIMQEQATICQLEQKLAEQLLTERQHIELVGQLPALKNLCKQGANCALGAHGEDQCAYVFAEVEKAGLRILGYRTEKERTKNNRHQSHSIVVSLKGTLAQIESFLASIAKSARLIQCTSLSLQHVEDKIFTAESRIQFIIYKI